MIAPHINQVLRALTQHLRGEQGDQWQAWRERYIPELLTFLKELRREAAVKSRTKTDAIAAAIDPLIPETKRNESLSRKALWVLASTPGVTCVLNGMRTPAYAEDSLGILAWEPLSNPQAIYDALRDRSA
jgi:aryl-alcohol dehydrogenase-like predicted oxidoreductase